MHTPTGDGDVEEGRKEGWGVGGGGVYMGKICGPCRLFKAPPLFMFGNLRKSKRGGEREDGERQRKRKRVHPLPA